MPDRKIKVLVVDDSAVSRAALTHELESDPAFEVVGSANSGAQAIEALESQHPDVVTMDIHMPGMDGFEATRKIMETQPLPIVIVSASFDASDVARTFLAMEAGAVAAVEKPPGFNHPDHATCARRFLNTVKAMSEVRVIKRWAKKESTVRPPPPAVILPAKGNARLVAIGASTGGPPALHKVLAGLVKPFPVPILIVQHITAGFVQGLADWLGSSSGLPVRIARHGEIAQPGTAYIAPDGTHMGVDRECRIVCADGPAGARAAALGFPPFPLGGRQPWRAGGRRFAHRHGARWRGGTQGDARQGRGDHRAGQGELHRPRHARRGHPSRRCDARRGSRQYFAPPPLARRRGNCFHSHLMTPSPAVAPDYSTLKGVEILVAEDSPTQAMKLLYVLEQQGCRATHAQNGRKALASLETHVPTLVITDVNMPEMDGFELCERIKSDPKLKDVPVILLTSLSAPQDIIRGLECGADNFVVKPYEADFLLSRLVTVLANRNLGLADDAREIPIHFAGQRYVITSRRRQILNLLLSTYETALKTNDALLKAQEDLKTAQQQLIEAEKIQSVGRLAAGVAHEVKNPLAIIEMGVDLLSAKPDAETVEMLVGEMKESVKRANHVIAGLMDVSSADESGMKDVTLDFVMDRVLTNLEPAITRAKVGVSKDYAGSLPMCRVDVTKIEQVFSNVVTNALQEMPDGGKLAVSVLPKVLRAEDVNFEAGDRSGFRFRVGDTAVIVEVRDTGGGILPENLTKVFEPFFSTRPTGKGMGLGLTVARKFMELHGGRIALANAPEGGTVVTMIFKTS